MVEKKGSLVCVGLGITLGAHISPASMHQIKSSDVVFVAASNGIVERWVETLNPDCRSLQVYYSLGKSRKQTYKEMIEVMLFEVENGKNVCGAFYGHPCVFALAPRKAIAKAREKGFRAYMEPGISAEACLYADLLIDPGSKGIQHFETSQFMYYKRIIDNSAYLVLWQVGLAGDKDSSSFNTKIAQLEELVSCLKRYYPEDHEVTIYEARVLPTDNTRIETINLKELPKTALNMISTLVVPPITRLIDIKQKERLNIR